ncbi:MAG: VIT1/CCC1 transporter family protein [Candidatus Bathyarchaeia archaeon]
MLSKRLLRRLKRWRKNFSKKFIKDESVAEIARRYFVMNAFDGALTILGVVAGTYMVEGMTEPRIIVSAGLGASLAMGISGGFGAYLTERSERVRDMNDHPDDPDSPNSIQEAHEEALFLAAVDAFSPALVALVGVFPFFLSFYQIVTIETALIASTVLILAELFALGAFLGKVAKRNMFIRGLITLLAGIATFLLCAILPF